MDGNFIHKKQPPKPKDTHKQSTLQECLSSAQSAKTVRPPSAAISAPGNKTWKSSDLTRAAADCESASLVLLPTFASDLLAFQLASLLR
jgi:hypothetical protein